MFQMLIHIVANDLKELDALTQQVKAIVGPFAKTLTPTTRMKDAFDSFLPIGKNKVSQSRLCGEHFFGSLRALSITS
ncbi:hypothetical protein [Geobacillus stearothermophilus]|nr:hypothetical protein [Geobacillus stearothermophilus]